MQNAGLYKHDAYRHDYDVNELPDVTKFGSCFVTNETNFSLDIMTMSQEHDQG